MRLRTSPTVHAPAYIAYKQHPPGVLLRG